MRNCEVCGSAIDANNARVHADHERERNRAAFRERVTAAGKQTLKELAAVSATTPESLTADERDYLRGYLRDGADHADQLCAKLLRIHDTQAKRIVALETGDAVYKHLQGINEDLRERIRELESLIGSPVPMSDIQGVQSEINALRAELRRPVELGHRDHD